jgi:uncharacterized protein YqgV (UPF0045/DUF77 family)
MQTSIDISYYPLLEEFIPEVQSFIDRLNEYSEISVKTNGMSTQVFGEYKAVMKIITDEIEKSFKLPNSIFVLKIANSLLDNYTPYND